MKKKFARKILFVRQSNYIMCNKTKRVFNELMKRLFERNTKYILFGANASRKSLLKRMSIAVLRKRNEKCVFLKALCRLERARVTSGQRFRIVLDHYRVFLSLLLALEIK